MFCKGLFFRTKKKLFRKIILHSLVSVGRLRHPNNRLAFQIVFFLLLFHFVFLAVVQLQAKNRGQIGKWERWIVIEWGNLVWNKNRNFQKTNPGKWIDSYKTNTVVFTYDFCIKDLVMQHFWKFYNQNIQVMEVAIPIRNYMTSWPWEEGIKYFVTTVLMLSKWCWWCWLEMMLKIVQNLWRHLLTNPI